MNHQRNDFTQALPDIKHTFFLLNASDQPNRDVDLWSGGIEVAVKFPDNTYLAVATFHLNMYTRPGSPSEVSTA